MSRWATTFERIYTEVKHRPRWIVHQALGVRVTQDQFSGENNS